MVTVFDTRRPPPGPVTAVSVRLGTDHPVPATVVSGGTWAARLPVLTEGDVGIEVRVTRAGAPTVTAHYGWRVAPAGRPEPRLVSRAPLRTGLRWAALVLAVGFALAGAVLLPQGGPRTDTGGIPRARTVRHRSGGGAGGQTMTSPPCGCELPAVTSGSADEVRRRLSL